MINSKLYKTYYPITTDGEKDIFIHENLTNIHRLLRKRTMMNMSKVLDIDKEYGKRMKKECSIFGNLKLGNIAHNKYVEHERIHDYRLKKIGEDNDTLAILEEKLIYNSLTTDDVNAILCIDNKQFRMELRLLIFGVLFVVVMLIIFK